MKYENKITEESLIHDIQADTVGFKNIPIQKVGVKNIKVPFTVSCKDGTTPFRTVANITSYCSLDEETKGINMSRISRVVNNVLSTNNDGFTCLREFVMELKKSHSASNVEIKAEFPYVIKNVSPMSELTSYEPVMVSFESTLTTGIHRSFIHVESTEMSLCPCSRDMSLLQNNVTRKQWYNMINSADEELIKKLQRAGFGAHNQKSKIQVTVELKDSALWIEDIVEIIKHSASAPTWTTLKRVDEKFVTEVSYMGGYYDDNHKFNEVAGTGAKFVEDISRDVAYQLNEILDKTINDYIIVVENEESIHSGDLKAVAVLHANRRLQ